MHHKGSLPGLAAKPLPKEVGDIRFIVHDQDACKRRSKNPSLKRPVGPVAPE